MVKRSLRRTRAETRANGSGRTAQRPTPLWIRPIEFLCPWYNASSSRRSFEAGRKRINGGKTEELGRNVIPRRSNFSNFPLSFRNWLLIISLPPLGSCYFNKLSGYSLWMKSGIKILPSIFPSTLKSRRKEKWVRWIPVRSASRWMECSGKVRGNVISINSFRLKQWREKWLVE